MTKALYDILEDKLNELKRERNRLEMIENMHWKAFESATQQGDKIDAQIRQIEATFHSTPVCDVAELRRAGAL